MPLVWDRVWWTRFAVGLSIALNVFFAAFLLAQTWKAHQAETVPVIATGNGFERDMPGREIVRQLARKLLPDDAHLLREAFRARLPQLIELRRAARRAADKVREDIGESTLDIDKLRRDLVAGREAREKIRPVVEDILLDVLPRMSDQGRQILSQYRFVPAR